MPAKKIITFFTSLRLTVVLLAFAIILVFIGTLAQVNEGLYNAQARYFRQWLILGLNLFGHKIPIILPGGYLLGTLLLINLLFAHIYRFQLSVKKVGIQLAHSGIILLLVGQLVTDMFAHESQIRFVEGETKSYAESSQDFELAFTSDAGANREQVVIIPQKRLASGEEITDTNLPFTIRVKSYWKNSEPGFRAPMAQNAPPATTNGVATDFNFSPAAEAKKMDDKNEPTAMIEIIGPGGSLGDWIVSGWTADTGMIESVQQSYQRMAGAELARQIVRKLTQPQFVLIGGKKFTFALRPERHYLPFTLTLLKATHTVYDGTDIPKDFRSRVQLKNSQTGENRETEIYMNAPLRYAGLTFYQYQMTAGQMAEQAGATPESVLQVVHNPGWLTPYLGCSLVAIGLAWQFLFHLTAFIAKRKTK